MRFHYPMFRSAVRFENIISKLRYEEKNSTKLIEFSLFILHIVLVFIQHIRFSFFEKCYRIEEKFN